MIDDIKVATEQSENIIFLQRKTKTKNKRFVKQFLFFLVASGNVVGEKHQYPCEEKSKYMVTFRVFLTC